MKTKFSKRILSLFLAVMMVVTSIPMFALTASAAGAYTPTKEDDKYLFAYFTGDGDGQKIRFAVSNDGINYYPLKNNEQILQHKNVSETITFNGKNGYAHDDGVRDPYIIKKPNADGYYIVATDLRVVDNEANTYNNSKLMVWDVPDISKADEVVPWNIDTWGMFANNSDYGTSSINVNYCAWAPEITYDYQKNMYMLFWSNGLYDSLSLYYVYTNDFKTFYNKDGATIDGTTVTPDILYQVSGTNTIDGDIAYDGSNYYLVFKHEYTGQIYFVKSSTPTGFNGQEPTKFVDSKYTGVNGGNGQAYEGPELYQRGDGKWVLIADNYTANPTCIFNMYVADSIDEFMNGTDFADKNIVTNINDCQPRHGGVAIIPSDICGSLISSYGNFSQYDASQLKSLISSYESTMNGILASRTVYKNLLPAYKAYVQARKAYDAYYYGGDTTVNLTTYAYFLKKAIDEMTAWTQYTANNPRPTFPSGTVPDNAYANLLYSSLKNKNAALDYTFDTNSSEMQIQVGYDETVMMYNGSAITPKAPVMFICRFKNGTWRTRTRYVYSVYPTTGSGATANHDDLFLEDKWYSSGGDGWNFGNEYGDTSYRVGHNSSTMNAGRQMKVTASANSGYISHSNVLNFDTTTVWSSGEYYKTYKNLYWNAYAGEGSAQYNGTGSVNDNATIYVVNYKALTDAIDTCFDKLPANVNSYKQGGLSAILGAIDNATGYDPNSSFFGVSSAYAGVTNFNKKVSALIDKLNLSASKDVDEDKYQALRTAMDNYVAASGNYTGTSINQYNSIYNASKSLMADVLDNGYVHGDWVGADATALNSKDSILNPLLDKTALNAAITAKGNPVIFDESGNQTKTYASWVNVNTKLNTAKSYQSYDGQYSLKNGGTYYDISNSYGYQVKGTYIKDAVDTATTELNGANLVDVDAADRYDSFDAAYEVANSVDMAKYNADGVKLITDAITDAYNSVYATAGANASIYNAATGTNYMKADTLLKLTTTGETDDVTTTLLNAINKANAPSEENDSIYPFVNQYKAVLNGDKDHSQSKYYGDMFSFNVTADADDLVTWLVTVYATEADMNAALAGTGTPTPVNSQVISTYNGATIERKADGFIVFESTVEKATDKTTTYAYKIYNAYGNVTDVIYSDTQYTNETIAAQIKTSPKLPFYTFNGWNVGTPDSNNVINVIPNFTISDYKTITVNGGTIKLNKSTANRALVGAEATITGNDGTYGWAVATGDKYQIVGYGKDYKFNVLNNEDYVAITTDGGKYYAGGVKLTPTNVAGFSNEYTDATMDDAAYLKAKLDSKAPFVYVQTTDTYKENGTDKIKVYVRVTAGAEENILSYGLEIVKPDDSTTIFNSTAKNDGGQFFMSMKKSSYDNNAKNINAFVNYSFTYTSDAGTSAEISTVDYAVVK